MTVIVVELTVLRGALVEVQGITQRVVLEGCGGGSMVAVAAVEAADERLPLRASDDLRPLTDLLEGAYRAGPPPVLRIGGAYAVPQRRR